MTIHEIDANKIKRFVLRCFSQPERSFLLDEAVFTHSYAVQFDHSEVEMFISIAKGVETLFSQSITISLYDEACEQEDCEIVEDCLSRRSSFHETLMAGNKGKSGSITVMAAMLESPQMQSIDYYTHFL